MKKLDLRIEQQVESECAVECLYSVLRYYGISSSRKELVREASYKSKKWRDWDYKICRSALKRGLKATVVTMSTEIFDPTWFKINIDKLIEKLEVELEKVKNKLKDSKKNINFHSLSLKIEEISAAITFFKQGGKIEFEPLSIKKIESFIDKNIPVFAPHNSTLLQSKSRMLRFKKNDTSGHDWGHVFLIIGYDDNQFIVADPEKWNRGKHYYEVPKNLLIESILRRNQNIYVVYK